MIYSQDLLCKPTIRILVYTDEPEADFNDLGFGLGTMRAHLEAHKPKYADLTVCRLLRNPMQSAAAANKLLPDLIANFDEIWFLGFGQINRRSPGGLFLRGTLANELEEEEIAALREWMTVKKNGGGVMVTGDHSELPPPDAVHTTTKNCSPESNERRLVLGRAIGRCIPRAGQLRRWRGKPSNDPSDSFNTQVSLPGIDPDLLRLQIDDVPQQLVLRHFSDSGAPSPKGQPHPLFWYNSNSFIRVFPDHAHEGSVVLPSKQQLADKDVWPTVRGVQPKPHIVAFGLDERNCRLSPVMAAYNGDSADVGRIVSDSSFHHYLNINLRNFPSPSAVGTAADKIGQYYANLAMWLCPRQKRQQMAYAMLFGIASHRLILEEFGNPPLAVGKAVYSLLSAQVATTEVHELLQSVMPEKFMAKFDSIFLPEQGIPLSAFPSRELILGTIVSETQRKMREVEARLNKHTERAVAVERTMRDAVEVGFNAAFATQATILQKFASAAHALN